MTEKQKSHQVPKQPRSMREGKKVVENIALDSMLTDELSESEIIRNLENGQLRPDLKTLHDTIQSFIHNKQIPFDSHNKAEVALYYYLCKIFLS
jgi:hypothetical protein